jgi:2-oxoglutarate ferredoxin oxidoreductase subunit alpha
MQPVDQAQEPTAHMLEEIESVVVRFAGDSGDGIQLTGDQFSQTTALVGNDLRTLPDYPAEIRAPVGTVAGVSGYQVQLGSEVFTPGDAPHALVALNPAALRASLAELEPGGSIILDEDEFTPANLRKAGFTGNPLEDGSLGGFQLHRVPLTTLNRNALAGVAGLAPDEADRCRNFFALGLVFWIYERPLEPTLRWLEAKFKSKPHLAEANQRALQAGYNFGHVTEAFHTRYRVRMADLPPGEYRRVTGSEATALGLIGAAQLAGKPLVFAAYPITPASDILHFLAGQRRQDVRAMQAEDELAAMGVAVGAAFGGAFAATATSGPGFCLKAELLNLAVMLELPVVVVDAQRAGPSTGMPTKPEQADLLQALFGRAGESPLPVVAACSPADCFQTAIEAFRLAVRGMTPVVMLSDAFLANSAEPWALPDVASLAPIEVRHPGPHAPGFQPYLRDPDSLARPWGLPGTPGLEHRIGGLSKQPGSGHVSYEPEDHERMQRERAEKIARLEALVPDLQVAGPERGPLLVLGWGSTAGAIRAAAAAARSEGASVASAHLRHLNPLPRNLGEVLGRYRQVLVPEMNSGQLAWLLQARFQRPIESLSKVQGRPIRVGEIRARIEALLESREVPA